MPEIDELAGALEEMPPCGADLTYDADFLALENAARGKPEQQFGTTVIPAEPPDWREVAQRAIVLLRRTKDIRIASMLCHAWTNTRGVRGTAAGLELLAALLERYWDAVHPLPEDGDHFMRTNAVAALDDVTGFIRDLRGVDFLRSSFGAVSVRDAEAIARGSAAESGSKMSLDQLRVAVADGWRQHDPALLAVADARGALQRIQSVLEEKLAGHQRPELSNLEGLLRLLREIAPSADASDIVSEEIAAESAQATASPPVALGKGPLRTRDDAIVQLLGVAEFLEQTEPTNPAPLLIRRAARLMRMSFIEILRELSPDSLAQVETVTGSRGDA